MIEHPVGSLEDVRRKGDRGSWLEWKVEETWLEETESRKEKRKENEKDPSSLEN